MMEMRGDAFAGMRGAILAMCQYVRIAEWLHLLYAGNLLNSLFDVPGSRCNQFSFIKILISVR